MKDETLRQIMIDAYRLLEKHETPSRDPDYWVSLIEGCNALCRKYPGNPLAIRLANALYDGLEELSHV